MKKSEILFDAGETPPRNSDARPTLICCWKSGTSTFTIVKLQRWRTELVRSILRLIWDLLGFDSDSDSPSLHEDGTPLWPMRIAKYCPRTTWKMTLNFKTVYPPSDHAHVWYYISLPWNCGPVDQKRSSEKLPRASSHVSHGSWHLCVIQINGPMRVVEAGSRKEADAGHVQNTESEAKTGRQVWA